MDFPHTQTASEISRSFPSYLCKLHLEWYSRWQETRGLEGSSLIPLSLESDQVRGKHFLQKAWLNEPMSSFLSKGKSSRQLLTVGGSIVKSCLTLCDPMDCSPPGSSVHGNFHARTLEWVAISSSRGSSRPKDWTHISCIGRRILYHWTTRGDNGPFLKSYFPWQITVNAALYSFNKNFRTCTVLFTKSPGVRKAQILLSKMKN